MKPYTPLDPLVLHLAHYTEPAEVVEASLNRAEKTMEEWRAEQDARFNRFMRRYKTVILFRALIMQATHTENWEPLREWKEYFDKPSLRWVIDPPSSKSL